MSTSSASDAHALRAALGAFPTGVTIVTTRSESGADVGLTANSFNSVSLDPPLVLWSLSKNAGSLPVFNTAEFFAVHVLSAQQQHLANLFATRDADRFSGLNVTRGLGDAPLLEGCAARFECRVMHRYEGGDHMILVGEVLKFEKFDNPVLAFHGGKYALALQRSLPARAAAEDEPFDMNTLNVLLGIAHRHLRDKLEPMLERQGLGEYDYWLLTMVAAESDRTVAKLTDLLRLGDQAETAASLDKMKRLGLVQLDGEGADARARLTHSGRRSLTELAAVEKSFEAAAEAGLDYTEAQLMHQLLRRLIFTMRPAHD